jgi:hypothetical protein
MEKIVKMTIETKTLIFFISTTSFWQNGFKTNHHNAQQQDFSPFPIVNFIPRIGDLRQRFAVPPQLAPMS